MWKFATYCNNKKNTMSYAQMRPEQFTNYQKALIDCGAFHVVESTSNSNSIKTKTGKYIFSETKINPKDLSFIKRAKIEIINNARKKDIKNITPKYFYLPKLPKMDIRKDCVEIDINGAYWNCAYKIGLISESTYLEGLKKDKITRLVSFGSAATVKTTYEYNTDESLYKFVSQKQDENGRNAFFLVSKMICEVMESVFKQIPGQCYFYWVDAIFLNSAYAEIAIEKFAELGYDVKIKKIGFIKYIETDELIKYEVCEYKENNIFCEYKIKYFQRKKANFRPDLAINRAKGFFF